MLRRTLGLSCGLLVASVALGTEPVRMPDVPVRHIHIGDVGVTGYMTLYSNWDTNNGSGYYWPTGATREYADDLHMVGAGNDCQVYGMWYYNGVGGVDDTTTATLNFYTSDADDTIDPFNGSALLSTILLEGMPIDLTYSWLVTFDLTGAPMDLGGNMHVWCGLTWETGDTGSILMSGDDIGTSHDYFWWDDGAGGGYYWFGGDPIANFAYHIEGDGSGGAACLGLDISTLVAGSPGSFTVTGDPGSFVAIAYSLQEGSTSYQDLAGWCADLGLKLPRDPRSNLVAQGSIDGLGEFNATVPVPGPAAGLTVYFQAAQKGTCPDQCISDVVARDIL